MGCLVNKDLLPGIIADSTLMKYAVEELKALGYTSASDGMDGMLYNDVIELLAVFVSQGHSNNSAPIILNMFLRIVVLPIRVPLRLSVGTMRVPIVVLLLRALTLGVLLEILVLTCS